VTTPFTPVCRICNAPAWNTNRKTRDYCRECYRAWTADYSKRRYHENYEFCARMMGGACIDCGKPSTPEKLLNFMHWGYPPDGDRRAPGRFMGHRLENLLQRVKWCDLVCETCRKRRNGTIPMTDKHQVRREKTQMLIDFFLEQSA